MKTPGAAVFLSLWSCLVAVTAVCGDKASTQETCQPDVHTVLREMSTLMAEQRVELRYTKTQMEALETRLTASERTVEEQRVELRQTEARLNVSENLLEELRSQNDVQEMNLEGLRKDNEVRRVAFSASLVAAHGPYGHPVTLLYKNVFSNIGKAYNINTGIFTAPVRGVYYFVVFIHGHGHDTRPTAVYLSKNGENIVMAWSHQPTHNMSGGNGVSLLLEVGDAVYVQLWPGAWVADNPIHHFNTFSGHLLFPV